MVRRSITTIAGVARRVASRAPVCRPNYLLNTLFKSSAVGVAICDRRLRFCAINSALASMNGIPAASHLGKTIHAVLGSAAAKIQPAFERVFSTGEPLSNFEVTAELPAREAVGHWNESYFPIKDNAGRVQQVGVIVLELTKRNEIDAAVLRLTNRLTGITSRLRGVSSAYAEARNPRAKSQGGLVRDVELLESCLSDARAISRLLHDAAPLVAARRPSGNGQVEREGQRDFAVTCPIENEPDNPSLLSSREREVVALLATGQTNKQIGAKLVISTRTVESHRARVMLKLDVHSLGELVCYAVRNRLIQP